MKEKISAFFKNRIKSRKFWVDIVIGVLFFCMAFDGEDPTISFFERLGMAVGLFFGGIICWRICCWGFKFIFKTGKVAGKVAVGAGKMAVKGAVMAANGSSSNNRQESTSSGKSVKKVWTMRYIGQGRSDGPEYLQVPSANQGGRPTGNEIKEALMALGYDRGTASSLANGGGESTWEVVS